MFLMRVPGFGNTTNLNRKRSRRPSTSPVVGRRSRPSLEALETRQLLSTYTVNSTSDHVGGSLLPGEMTLRQAIVDADASSSPADIVFNIPAATSASNYDVPVPGFDPETQTWRIQLATPLPAIKNTVSIDGYSQAHDGGVPFRYSSLTSAVQGIFISGSPTGGSFTLTTASPLPTNTTVAIPWNAGAGVVQAALGAIVGPTNVTVTGGPAPNTDLIITFQNKYAQQTIQPLVYTNDLTGGTNPGISVYTIDPGGTVLPSSNLTYIQSIPNTTDALQGNNAEERVIIDGSQIPSSPADIGFVLDASHSLLRGLIISGFNVGVSVLALDSSNNPVVGDLIQGNSIGDYYTYPVDSNVDGVGTGSPLPVPG